MSDTTSEAPTLGTLAWIGLRPAPRAAVRAVEQATVVEGQGLRGDRFEGRPGGAGTRQVTLVASDDLRAAAERLGRPGALDPADLRRNLLLEGVDLAGRTFAIGSEVLLETTGGCPPCGRMDETVGAGGREALRGLAGITARVVRGGVLRLGDPVTLASAE